MGKLIKFPAHRVVHNNPKSPDLTEEEARQIKEDGGLTLMQQVEDTLEQKGETIEPEESDIEMSATPSGELEPPRKGLMGKVN